MTRNTSKVTRKALVWKKTGGICAHCGRKASSRSQTIDHYIPKSWGGSYDLRNLMPLCSDCNVKRGSRPINPYSFYKYASKSEVNKCKAYEDEFNFKYRSMGDSE